LPVPRPDAVALDRPVAGLVSPRSGSPGAQSRQIETTWRRRASSASSPSSVRSSSGIQSSYGIRRREFPGHPMRDDEIFQIAGQRGVCGPAAAMPSGQHDSRRPFLWTPNRFPPGPPPGRRFKVQVAQARPSRPNSRRPGRPRPNSKGSTRRSTTWPLAERPSSSELFLSQRGRPLSPSGPVRTNGTVVRPSLPILHSLLCSSALWAPRQACRLLHRPRYTRFPGLSVRSHSCGMNGRLGLRASRPGSGAVVWTSLEAFRE
jgi:hypothetical protein